jgi:phosphinothricin acetyltransferase
MSDPKIRAGREADLESLTALYNHYVRETAITFDIDPFSVEERRPWLSQFKPSGPHRLLVAESGDQLLGYAASMRFRPKAAYETSVETSVYLVPEAKGRGIGSRLYRELFAAIDGEDLHRALAGITLPNSESIALHRKFGFTSIGTYRQVGRKFERYWDVEWFERALP